MGNRFICMNKKDTKNGGIGSRSKRGSVSKRRSSMEEELLHRQALAMAIQQHQLSQRFDGGSMSRRLGSTSSRRRAANLSDPFSTTNSKPVNFKFCCFLCFCFWQLRLLLLIYEQDLNGEKGSFFCVCVCARVVFSFEYLICRLLYIDEKV